MPKHLLNRWHGLHMIWTFVLMIAMTVGLFAFQWTLGVISLLLCGIVVYYTMVAERAFRKDLNAYVGTLSHRIKKAGNEVINALPIGIVLHNEEKFVEWHNPYLAKILDRESVIGANLYDLFPDLKAKKEKDGQTEFALGDKIFRVLIKSDERLMFLYDITAYTELSKRYDEEKLAIGVLMLDNVDEATQGMDDQSRSVLMAKVISEITEWANKYSLYLRRTAADKFLILMNQKALRSLEQDRFEILDDVRDLTGEYKLPMTLSIGVAAGVDSLIELGNLAQTSLDIALGRGGDQAAVKVGSRLSFYGGRSNAVEKRTRVRARVIAHALRDLIRESDNVLIMGHKIPDMDAIGAAVGVLKAVQYMNKPGYIVLEGVNPSILTMMQTIRENEELNARFITPEDAYEVTSPRTLIVVLDTHKASLVAEPKLLQQSHRIVIVDHHRRSEEFINDATLIYLEPYASSTCELVTELLQYFHERLALEPMEATMLLAGIVVDTKSFALRTGARTFEAASFLRRNGADSAVVQRMLKEDLEEYVKKAEIIRNVQIINEHLAIAVTEPGRKYPQLLIAKVADTLLNITGIRASFVVSERPDGLIGISARSLGQINVQVIMERLGGGGHLTNAATQIEGSLQMAEKQLRNVLEEIHEEEGLFE